MNKFISIVLAAFMTAGLASSCVGDLDVTPIDPNTTIPEDVLNSQDAFTALLAKCYQSFCVSSSYGESGGPDIDGVDGGYGQFLRAVLNLQELPTDEMFCQWNDDGLQDLHAMNWTASNQFINAMYQRIFYSISLCNEFIRRSNEMDVPDYSLKDEYIAEARALRLYCYYNAIDMFGNVPFFTEENSVGSTSPERIARADLFDWMVEEATELLADANLAEPKANVYGRVDKTFVRAIRAKLYLNAEVWKGTSMWNECAADCEAIYDSYDLAPNYAELFCADNHLHTANTTYNGEEIIFAFNQDGNTIRSYGATNYIIFGATGNFASDFGISSGWGGLSITGEFTSKFASEDVRAMFTKEDADGVEFPQYATAIAWENGWKCAKYTNINHDGSAASNAGFVDTDYPAFRAADFYLMLAECQARGASTTRGLAAFNEVRSRAGISEVSSLSLDEIIDERGRELYYEGVRRQDLIRFGQFTSSNYLWEFKGGVEQGTAVDSYRALYPIPSAELNSNGNLSQNEGYGQ